MCCFQLLSTCSCCFVDQCSSSRLLLHGPVDAAMARLGPVADALRRLPRSRLFHLLLVAPGERVDPETIRKNLALLEDASLFLVPVDQPPQARSLLREVFVRTLP